MSIFVVDVETDGPAPGLYSMVCFGAVLVDRGLTQRFKGHCAPISANWKPEALAVSGYTREQHAEFEQPELAMARFCAWLRERNEGKMVMLSDNPTFDGAFINYYMHAFVGDNPFGHSARRLGDFCAGLERGWVSGRAYRALRKTPHSHDPVDDAVGNAEAFVALCDQHGVKIPGVPPLEKAPSAKPGP